MKFFTKEISFSTRKISSLPKSILIYRAYTEPNLNNIFQKSSRTRSIQQVHPISTSLYERNVDHIIF
jgi:hypothetical protein